VAGLAVVAALLLVPPIAVRVAVSALLWGRVDVAAILRLSALSRSFPSKLASHLVWVCELLLLGIGEGCADLGELRAWAGYGRDNGASQRAGRYNAPGEHAGAL